MVNRQFHFKKKHSYDTKPLEVLKPLKKARRRIFDKVASRKKKRVGVRDQKEESGGDGLSGEELLARATRRDEEEQKKRDYKSFQSFLEDVEDDDDDDHDATSKKKDDTSSNSNNKPTVTTRSRSKTQSSTLPKERKKDSAKDLLDLASKIEVFSYLSPEAVADILDYVEYVDFSQDNVGKMIFDNNTLDGSMYAVVSGSVTMSLSIYGNNSGYGNAPKADDDDSPCFSFVAHPGEVMTSMLTIITSLIREYQLQDAFISSPIPGVVTGGIINSGDSGGMSDGNRAVIPQGINVRAVVSSPNTRLLRIPSRCFVAILEKFPKDVHQICQQIVARLQRVTIQTLVRFLGLDAGVLGTSGSGYNTNNRIPEKKARKTLEWARFEHSLSGEAIDISSPELLDQATTAAASLFGLSPEHSKLLKDGSSIVSSRPGSVLCRSGEFSDSIYIILKGSLEVSSAKNDQSLTSALSGTQVAEEDHLKAIRKKVISTTNTRELQKRNKNLKPLFNAGSGSFIGMFSCFTNDASLITVRNNRVQGAVLLKISSCTFESIVSKYPRVLIHCLLDIVDAIGDGPSLCVSSPMFLLDWCLDWMHVEAGEYIATKGEQCDSMFVVLNGRLRVGSSSEESSTKGSSESSSKESHKEFGRGATIGELEALADGHWSHSVYASRHCEVARIPMSLLNILMTLYPTSGIHFAKVIARLQNKGTKTKEFTPTLLPSYALSLATIAVVPLTPEVNLSEFCSSLTNSLRDIAPTKLLTKRETMERVGEGLFKHKNKLLNVKMTRILGDIEENNRLVVYEAEMKYTWWTKISIQQADLVLVVVDSANAPDILRVEPCLAWAKEVKNIRIELVVVQSTLSQEVSNSDEHASDNLNNWSEQRLWISKHHLIRQPFADHLNDFRRMCRRVTGQSIGLVLGGGGARGLAHLGVIRALNEMGVAVDMVGGTSQGAFVGALFAKNPDNYDDLEKTLREMAVNMSSIKEKLLDLTFPLTSFFNGSRFNKGIQKFLGDIRIQDLVLNFFCVSVDIR